MTAADSRLVQELRGNALQDFKRKIHQSAYALCSMVKFVWVMPFDAQLHAVLVGMDAVATCRA